MKLTCVTATFNCIKAGNRERLIRCVESVAKLKTEHEHLIYDGASKDGTAELLRELESKTPGLKVISEPDTGIYNALNKGVRDAKGEWFYVLGADDYISHPEVMDEVLKSNNVGIQVIVSPVERDGGFHFFQEMNDMKGLLGGMPYSHQGLITRTLLVRSLQGFDERFRICADWNLMLKAHESGAVYRFTYNPFAFYSMGGFSEDEEGIDEVFSVLQEHIGFSDEDVLKYRRKGYWPIHRMLPYLFHKDYSLRLSARYMIWKAVKPWGRFFAYPIVVATRSLRCKNRKDS